jgi:hypothetical protein
VPEVHLHPDPPRWKSTCRALLLTFSFFAVGVLYGMKRRGWLFSDSLYFTVVTLTTVGYGDLAADTQEHKIFLSFFVVFGVVFIASTVEELVEDMGERLRDEFILALDEASGGAADEEAHQASMMKVV